MEGKYLTTLSGKVPITEETLHLLPSAIAKSFDKYSVGYKIKSIEGIGRFTVIINFEDKVGALKALTHLHITWVSEHILKKTGR